MWFSIVAWIALLIASAFFAGATLNLDPAQISIQFKALPGPQRFALAAILFTSLSLIGSSVWQSWSLARQNKWLRDRLKGLRQGSLAAHETQQQFDAAVQHLVQTDPEDAIASLQKTLGETEQRAALQKSGSDAGDLQSRLDEIRRRQQALREVIGTVAEKRRVMEPIFGELKDRLRQLDRSLTNLETDDNKNSLADRMLELERDVTSVHKRQGLLQETLATLNRFMEEMNKSQAELVPLRAPESGIYALIAELRSRHEQLTATLDELETRGDEKLSARVEALSRDKLEVQQRVARLDDSFHILDAIRLDFEELRQHQAHLERSLAEVETDSAGRSLVDRQNAVSDFIIQSRLRLRKLQESSATLNQFKEDLTKSQAELGPLQAPVFGIEALIGDVNASRDLLTKTLGEIEIKGDQELSSRVETLSKSKLEVDQRISRVFENFQKLDSMRKDIGEIFTSIRSTLNRIG
jgi:chromosome segregation ATPase